jgi:hypothetical protein
MAKRASLEDALHQASQQKRASKVQSAGETTLSQPIESVGSKAEVPPSRRGKKLIGGHFDKAVSYQLKRLALDSESSVQQLLAEAINDLFKKHDLPPIA